MTAQQQLPPPAQMMQTITGVWTSCCIYNAAKLNVAEILVAKPLSIAQLAEATHSHAPSRANDADHYRRLDILLYLQCRQTECGRNTGSQTPFHCSTSRDRKSVV